MTTQYNVVTYGNLTNTNGVLSGFSANDYATIPLNFNPTQKPYEVVFKFTGTNGIIWNIGDVTTARGHIEFEVYQNKLYAEFAANETLIWSIEGVTTISPNTNYWVKLVYDGVDTYSLYLSTDGITWNLEGTATSSDFLGDGSTEYNLIGVQISGGVIGYAFNGSIDLNGSYINIDNIRWWQGATTVSNVRTKVQLRHDTAANWTSVNPILLDGEVGIETDTRKQKFGDGVTAWNSLPYDAGSTALQSITSSDVTTALEYTPVNKAGDTMTGNLTTSGILATSNAMRIVHSGITRDGSTPSASSYKLLNFVDNGSTPLKFGAVQSAVYTNGGVETGIFVFKNQVANASERISINYNNLGDVYTYAPACETNNSIVTTVGKSKTQNGYYKLGNGLIIQWGEEAATSMTGTVTLPTAFSSTDYAVSITGKASSNQVAFATNTYTTATFNWRRDAGNNLDFRWIAIGY